MAQATDIERIQKTSLKVILGDNYVDYPAALEMSGLQTLYERRERRCLDFALKSLKHPINSRMFPINSNLGGEGMEAGKHLRSILQEQNSTECLLCLFASAS